MSIETVAPACECHGEPMRWQRNAHRKAGGSWRCAVKARAADRKRHEQNREKDIESCRKWREQNQEKVRENRRRWLEQNREKCRENSRKWAENNPDKARARNERRIYVGSVYLGRENNFSVPREEVEKFALQMITQHRKDNAHKSVDALVEAQ